MKVKILFFLLLFASCNENEQPVHNDPPLDHLVRQEGIPSKELPVPLKPYANQRFRNVIVERSGDHRFLIKGEGQLFEASLNWVVEDGHNELKQGFETTDAGAPAWGKFSFMVEVQKVNPNSTLHLILFETSAKDGSRQYELPVLLY